MDSTETLQASASGGHEEGQLISGRYRLASFHGGDDTTDVWRALDETQQQIVTLEILRDRDNEARRQHFLAEARRMAGIERPTVMRVAAINDNADATYIVFEHLVPLPVVLTAVKPVVEAIATNAPTLEAPTVAPAAAAPTPPASVAPAPAPQVATPPTPSPVPVDQGATGSLAALRALLPSKLDAAIVAASASELGLTVRELIDDIRSNTTLAAVRDFVSEHVDASLIRSLAARATAAAGRLATFRPSVRVAAPRAPRLPRAPKPPRAPKAPRVQAPAVARISTGPSLASRVARRVIGRVRIGRVITRGLAFGFLAAAIIVVPFEDVLGKLKLEDVIAKLQQSVADIRLLGPAASAPALAPAGFDVPALSAYGASFESQAPYPTAAPNGDVEWVVALRNTGSVGWYRGIEGAQASLALADGTGVAVQSTAYVAPGQVGWFVARFRAPAEPGTHTVSLFPRIDGRGELPDLGIYAVVTVKKP